MTIELKELEKEAREIGKLIDRGLKVAKGERIGFVLLLFDFGGSGNITYLSNGRREDMIEALKELIGKLETH